MPIELGTPECVLDWDAFQAQFRVALQRTQSAFRKLEVDQFYDESGDPSYDKLMAGDWDGAMAELDCIVQDQDELLSPAIRRGVSLTRLRYVSFPMTDYVRWELASYRLSENIGERVFITENKAVQSELPEFISFDEHTLITLRYDNNGVFSQAWLFSDPEKITATLRRFDTFVEFAVPLKTYEARLLDVDEPS
jgi:hypothetical protein